MYPPIPILAAPSAAESLNQYAARALAHAMQHGTAGLDSEALAQAARFAVIAVAAPDILPTAADRITATIHQIRAAERYRADQERQERAATAAALAAPPPPPPASGGQRSPVQRTPPPSFPPADTAQTYQQTYQPARSDGSPRPRPQYSADIF